MRKQMDEEDQVEELDFEIQLMDSETEEKTGKFRINATKRN